MTLIQRIVIAILKPFFEAAYRIRRARKAPTLSHALKELRAIVFAPRRKK